jgi:phage shock protein C
MSKLIKSNNNRILFGVCGGIAEYSGLDASLVRLLFILGTIFTGSLLFWLYLILGIILPKE